MNINQSLFTEIKQLIEQGRQQAAQAVNASLTATYWHIGKRINEDVLQHKRAEYGKQIVAILSQQLTEEYGKGWSVKLLLHCLRFAEIFPNFQIVSALWRQLSWSHLKTIMYLKTDIERDFYTQMCRLEQWSTRTLQKRIDSMLFERTVISKKPEELAKLELMEKSKTIIISVYRDMNNYFSNLEGIINLTRSFQSVILIKLKSSPMSQDVKLNKKVLHW